VDEEVARSINATLERHHSSELSRDSDGSPHMMRGGSNGLQGSPFGSGKERWSSGNMDQEDSPYNPMNVNHGGQDVVGVSAASHVSRSAASMLARGRTKNVLPNGGGRLWALRDVTGLGIW
jgi:hypothetical protein